MGHFNNTEGSEGMSDAKQEVEVGGSDRPKAPRTQAPHRIQLVAFEGYPKDQPRRLEWWGRQFTKGKELKDLKRRLFWGGNSLWMKSRNRKSRRRLCRCPGRIESGSPGLRVADVWGREEPGDT